MQRTTACCSAVGKYVLYLLITLVFTLKASIERARLFFQFILNVSSINSRTHVLETIINLELKTMLCNNNSDTIYVYFILNIIAPTFTRTLLPCRLSSCGNFLQPLRRSPSLDSFNRRVKDPLPLLLSSIFFPLSHHLI